MAHLIFMGTPEFSVQILERLIKSGHQISAVYTRPDSTAGRGQKMTSPAIERVTTAEQLEIYQPTSIKQPDEIKRIRKLSPDAIVVAAFGQILPDETLEIPPFGCINVHPSLLPHHRGPSPVASAILAGDEITGVTIMLIESRVDAGPILAQAQLPVLPDDTTGSLSNKLAQAGAELLDKTLPRWFKGELNPQPQNDGDATYSKLLTKEDGEIDWRLSATEIWHRVRAFQPWPGCYTWWRGRRLKVIEAAPIPGKHEAGIGHVVSPKSDENAIAVQTGDGLLELRQVQLEGKRPMKGVEFSRGQRDFIKSLLASKSK
jgi:methionyl-tRNA formyltransferase